MKDLHNHLLYNIDDGSESFDKSIKILKDLEKQGVTDIVVTPHYIIGTNYNSNNKTKKELIKKLQKTTNINLYIGNEVYIDNNIIEYIDKDEISTINNSKYLLVEFPLGEKLDCAFDIIFKLRNGGFIPIIAHPERYSYLKIEDLVYLIDQGCLLQGNITSLSNKYGKAARKNLETLLKKDMIHILGTDTHGHGRVDLNGCYESLKQLVSEKRYEEITKNNFEKIINNKKIDSYPILNTNTFFRKEKWQ